MSKNKKTDNQTDETRVQGTIVEESEVQEALTQASNDESNNDRTPRDQETREAEVQAKPWAPPQLLETPEPPPGIHYRWVRTAVRGEEDRKNVHYRFREGYVPVTPEEVNGYHLPTINEGEHAGTVGIGGLILCKIAQETVDQRNNYYQNRTDAQMEAVDNDLMKDEHPAMPITRERKTQVTFGGSKR
jgi:hypothetical protein